eukprot:CAMPEP_0113527240 /NCGR_PEP_ID=MMETSP0015_2-20120614/1187_1 /TAXON_ID=2838 /ORGANISM="Odontella" /LENGTH=181 /DNA_ID=CAMNT_0000425655 /DNA_START=152 /DNA_END=695 /DNA_ORIENTATION=+ /assembly_acc=CAM_ASM_000160
MKKAPRAVSSNSTLPLPRLLWGGSVTPQHHLEAWSGRNPPFLHILPIPQRQVRFHLEPHCPLTLPGATGAATLAATAVLALHPHPSHNLPSLGRPSHAQGERNAPFALGRRPQFSQGYFKHICQLAAATLVPQFGSVPGDKTLTTAAVEIVHQEERYGLAGANRAGLEAGKSATNRPRILR